MGDWNVAYQKSFFFVFFSEGLRTNDVIKAFGLHKSKGLNCWYVEKKRKINDWFHLIPPGTEMKWHNNGCALWQAHLLWLWLWYMLQFSLLLRWFPVMVCEWLHSPGFCATMLQFLIHAPKWSIKSTIILVSWFCCPKMWQSTHFPVRKHYSDACKHSLMCWKAFRETTRKSCWPISSGREELVSLDDWQHSPTACTLSFFLSGVSKSNQEDKSGCFVFAALGKITFWTVSFLKSHESVREEDRMWVFLQITGHLSGSNTGEFKTQELSGWLRKRSN